MKQVSIFFLIVVLFFPAASYSQTTNIPEGKASYYAKKFHGRKTASGEIFSNYDYTAAHRSLPFNTYLNVVNIENNFNIIVRVNDRGPYVKNRVIDLTEAASRRVGGYNKGLVHVKIEILDLLHLTPELEQIFSAAPVVDCLGRIADLSGVSLSLWSTNDLVHAIYIANDLYLKEHLDQVLIVPKETGGIKKYYVVVSGIEDKENAAKLKEEFERKGFMKVTFFDL